MKNEAQPFKSLVDETRLKILWLLMARDIAYDQPKMAEMIIEK